MFFVLVMIWISTSLSMIIESQNLKAKLTLFLHALVLGELVEAAAPQLLPVLQQLKVLALSWLPGVDGTPVHVSLAVAQSSPALQPLTPSSTRDSKFADVTQNLNISTSTTTLAMSSTKEKQKSSNTCNHPDNCCLQHHMYHCA